MFNFVIFVVNKEKVGQKNFSPSSFVAVVGSEILELGSRGAATLIT
jgi:hypothetical protein